jgi:hypothetical protein
VVAHGAAVTGDRVTLAAQPQLGRWRRRRQRQAVGTQHRECELGAALERDRRRFEVVDHTDRAVYVVDLDQTLRVRAPEPQLTRCAQ